LFSAQCSATSSFIFNHKTSNNKDKATMRSRSISPSTSIRSCSSDYSDSDDDSDDTTRYDGLTEAELNEIWERRNLAYYNRRQRKLAEAEEKERQQQQDLSGDDPMAHDSCSINSSSSSSSAQDYLGPDDVELSAPPSESVNDLQQPLTRPEGFLCAADCPEWRDFTSRNIMGEYDPERASREPGYRSGWLSCERLVNMNRTGATAGNFIPTNPRLAALMEHRRLEVARERCEEEAMRRQQQQSQGGDFFTPSAAQQAAEYDRLNQVHRLQQQRESASSPKCSSSGSLAEEKMHGQGSVQVQPPVSSFYLALANPTQQLTKPVRCDRCNLSMFTAVPARQFFCQTCGCVSSVPSQGAESLYDEKMQDAEDLDCKMSSY